MSFLHKNIPEGEKGEKGEKEDHLQNPVSQFLRFKKKIDDVLLELRSICLSGIVLMQVNLPRTFQNIQATAWQAKYHRKFADA